MITVELATKPVKHYVLPQHEWSCPLCTGYKIGPDLSENFIAGNAVRHLLGTHRVESRMIKIGSKKELV